MGTTSNTVVEPLTSLPTITSGLPFGLSSADTNAMPSAPRSSAAGFGTLLVQPPVALTVVHTGAPKLRWFT
ncbi:MAG: hypothetical protein MUE62_13615 [Burkholderiaceae bacterium]|nr:hypothetical protein [Burkholderiaceae bacterium]